MGIEYKALDEFNKYLIGSYFTHEYSIESAAFFNPSVVEDPDQSITYAEFSYMLIQGFDFLTLFEKYGVQLQLG